MRAGIVAVVLSALLAGCTSVDVDGAGGDDVVSPSASDSAAVSASQPGWPTIEVLDALDLEEPVAPTTSLHADGIDLPFARAYADYLADEVTYALRTSIADPRLRNSWCEVCADVVSLADRLREDRQLVRLDPVRVDFVGVSDEQVRHIVRHGATVWIDVDLVVPRMQVVDEAGAVRSDLPAATWSTRLEVARVGANVKTWWTYVDEGTAPRP